MTILHLQAFPHCLLGNKGLSNTGWLLSLLRQSLCSLSHSEQDVNSYFCSHKSSFLSLDFFNLPKSPLLWYLKNQFLSKLCTMAHYASMEVFQGERIPGNCFIIKIKWWGRGTESLKIWKHTNANIPDFVQFLHSVSRDSTELFLIKWNYCISLRTLLRCTQVSPAFFTDGPEFIPAYTVQYFLVFKAFNLPNTMSLNNAAVWPVGYYYPLLKDFTWKNGDPNML